MYSTSLAAGIINDLTGLGKDLKTLLTVVVLGIIYVASVGATWAATRSMLKAGVAAAGGAVVMGIIASQATITDKTAEEFEKDHTVGQGVVRVIDTSPPTVLVASPTAGSERPGRV
ncbi:hypothetical protein OG887_44595 (plasmid) [Streptomyces sp. NBC_00053]|uniref:hypothetical protein n=1 Tax=unclassified Streptomyces TaxID=2593676 RepID=UPI000FB6816C|nr:MULTISPECIES: hypothetical protein [unclassified Streptomyces]MCX4399934.1 hypothetical protein [Streptomyces sp. NBC_01767]MCX5506062.1 hypothetical protein [Streptomyces sp. NBC_00052]MCX5554283.1 hypothetical protein [Streptomyces sp. NBC_00051]RPK55657.1 hypothetical protein EES42_41865 [Streptomyces sp. ADI95-17]WSP52965.1 hypothetical protein OG348_45780 [Streptomyces sp. NBC_01243]